MQKNEEKSCQQASKIKLFEASYGDSNNELQIMIAKRPQIEKMPQTFTLETLFSITSALACILKQIFIFSALTLPLFLASFVDRHFSLRLHGRRPSLNGMLEFADHKRSRQA